MPFSESEFAMHYRYFFVFVFAVASGAIGQESSKPLTVAEAAKQIDKQVTLEMAVRSTGGNRNKYLNSAADYSSPNNFTVYIPEAAVKKFAEAKVEKPDEHFYGKTIEVTGTVTLVRNKPQLTVNDPSQIKVLEDKSGPPVHKVTHIYKRAGMLAIRADSYQFVDKPKQPVVVWIHGGGLINGHREGVPQWLTDVCRQSGFVLVSLDYRLAPETKLPDIISDIEDAFRWIRDKGPELFGADADRIAVVGGSAGGYLTLITGYRVQPRPKCLVSLWGYGDLIGPWYSEPSSHPRHQTSKLSRDEAYKQVSGQPISDSRDRDGNGGAFYQFCRQTGTWPQAVTGWDPRTEAEKFVPFMPAMNVTADYPATLLIHGDKDTDVPFEQSLLMASELKKHKVEHQLIAISDAEHGLAGAREGDADAAYRAAGEFLRKHLERSTER
jgi:acetyl esterase/lipase